MKDLRDLKDEHDFCDESEQNFMLMEWVAWSPDRATQECSWPQNEKGCVTLWAIGMILSVDHEGNEYSLAQPLLRMKDLHFIKDECDGKPIHPKLPIEVHLKWRVSITSIGHQSKSRNNMRVLNHLIWLASIDNRGFECEFISLDSIGMSLWSLDQTDESYRLTTQWSMSRHIPRWKHLIVCLDMAIFQGWIS